MIVDTNLPLRLLTGEAAISCRDSSIDLDDCYLDAVARERGLRALSFDRDFDRLGNRERP